MHLIKVNVPEGRVDEIKEGLMALGVERLRIAEINGYTRGREVQLVWRGCRMMTNMLHEFELEAIVCDESVDEAVSLIITTARKAAPSDGFVCVTPVEQCYRIKTGNPQY